MTLDAAQEGFTEDERARLAPFFTDLDGPVFALTNLPEVVKGALFARYSRSQKSLRRLFLDEFAPDADAPPGTVRAIGVERAEQLYERVFLEYGDDSVAQLGGVHLACEDASQLLAKVLERGRLAGYLEQSTRYIPYDGKPGGRYRYHVPDEVEAIPALSARYRETLDEAFDLYARWLEPMRAFFRERFPQEPGDSDFVYRSTINAKACDTLRPLLPAATRSNVGIYAVAQSYEQLLLRMRGSPLAEVRAYADLMLAELRKVIPAFLTRVDVADRGGAWTDYLRDTRASVERAAGGIAEVEPEPRPEVTLTEWDPDGETKVVAAALYEVSQLPDDQLLEIAREMTDDERARVLSAAVGHRTNRRHRPGRAFERTSYRFDVLCDYGAFRDLQRHRMLTIQWQRLTPERGFEMPPEVRDAGAEQDWQRVMETTASLHGDVLDACGPDVAQYPVAMAYRIRFVMHMNAREALHTIELRSGPQGHPVYRRVAQQMHRLIAEEAGHRAIAAAMSFVDTGSVDLERLAAERRTEARREALRGS